MIMLCDTVCLSCVFSLVAEGGVPDASDPTLLNVYVFCLGLSITLFSISLWCSVIVVRRLHDHTAATLERKLFAQSDDLQLAWKNQLEQKLPTGPAEMHLVNMAYEQWVSQFVDPLGQWSIHLLSIGVVAMFVTAGLLTHLRYMIEFEAPSAAFIFWSTVGITSLTVVVLKVSEDRSEKKKLGVYDNAWQDTSTLETGPFAKILRSGEELFSHEARTLASNERMERLGKRERTERELCTKTKSLYQRVESLRNESRERAKTRKAILQLLTTAAEELDALPEDLTAGLNKMLHNIDEADARTANWINIDATENVLSMEGSQKNWSHLQRMPPREPMAPHPIDAQRISLSLVSIRKKLGELPLTTLLRIKNLSDEPLRLKSGVQMKEGRYIKSLNAPDPSGNVVCHHLYPSTEIPARSEICIASRTRGRWVPTSGILGQIVYVNRDETWSFRVDFHNGLVGGSRRCQVEAVELDGVDSGKDPDSAHQYWQISREELDRKANSEVVVSIDYAQGKEAEKAEFERRQSERLLKSGFLLKNQAFGLRLQWRQRFFELTPLQLDYSQDAAGKKRKTIFLTHIRNIRHTADIVQRNVFELHTSGETEPIRLAAPSIHERDDWIQKICDATGLTLSEITEHSDSSIVQEGIECVRSPNGTDLMPV